MHQPLSELHAWKSIVLAFLAIAIISLPAFAIGRRAVNNTTSVPLKLAVGLNLYGLCAVMIGMLGFPNPIVVLTVLAILGVIDFVCHVRWAYVRNQPITAFCKSPEFLGLLFTFGTAISYPSGWDELVYHVSLPMRWTADGFLSVQKDLPYSAFPSLAEILFWNTSEIEPLIFPRLLSWVAWCHSLFLMYESLARFSNPLVARSLVWAIGLSNVFLMIGAKCYIETFLVMDLAAILAILSQEETHSRQQCIVIGILCGAAIATKLTAVTVLVVPLLMFNLKSSPFGWHKWKTTALFLLTAVSFAFPFYLRTYLNTGNPFFPFFASWFTQDTTLISMSQYHHQLATENFGVRDLSWLGVAPFAVSFAAELYDGAFGLQWLLLLGVLAFGVKYVQDVQQSRFKVIAAVTASVMLYVAWFFTSQQARFGIPVFILGAVGSSFIVAGCSATKQKLFSLAIIVLSLVSAPWGRCGYYVDSWLCAVGIRTPREYIARGTGETYTDLCEHLQKQPHEDRVLCFFEHRLCYMPPQTEIGTPYFQSKLTPEGNAANAGRLLTYLRENGFRRLIVTRYPKGPDLSTEWLERQSQWLTVLNEVAVGKAVVLEWESSDYLVLAIKPASGK